MTLDPCTYWLQITEKPLRLPEHNARHGGEAVSFRLRMPFLSWNELSQGAGDAPMPPASNNTGRSPGWAVKSPSKPRSCSVSSTCCVKMH